MSAADVEIVREMFETFNRGEYEEATAMLHERVEMYQASEIPDTGTYLGRDEFVRGLSRWLSGFEPGFQYVPEEMVDAGDLVFMAILLRGVGRGSGVKLEQRIFHVWEVRDGKPFRVHVFWEEQEARRVAGLEP